MKRLNPVGSLLGAVLTILLFVGLGTSLYLNRGLAFSPGALTAKAVAGVNIAGFTSHMDFEKLCGKCHDPLRTTLATKCLACHTDVMEQLQSRQGVHSQVASSDECASCHPEHRGRSFDPTLASYELFDHSKTNFSLVWHQENFDTTPMQCSECHTGTDFSVVANQTCQDCHTQQDASFSQAHLQEFGSDCLGCHDGADRMQDFDHSQTGFALDGRHAETTCMACHTSSSILNVPHDCQGCHSEPGIHQAVFSQACDTCHSTQGWSPATLDGAPFAHHQTTGFSLALHQVDYSNLAITCVTCHPTSLQTYDLGTCVDCHTRHDMTFVTGHIQQYGSDCLVCHDGVDRLSNFQHADFFSLDGKHASIQCADCHANQEYRGTSTECTQCHAEPAIHAGVFGLKCNYCHTTDAWSPASLRQHAFPLSHGLPDVTSQSTCDACHGKDYTQYTCYTCHAHQPEEIAQSHQAVGISDNELQACITCHPDGLLARPQEQP